MIIAFNHGLDSGFGRRLLSGILAYTAGRRDVELWLAWTTAIRQQVPKTIDGMIDVDPNSVLWREIPNRVNVSSEPCEDRVQVCSDNHAIAELALHHFLSRNIRSFAFLKAAWRSSLSRCPAFEKACSEQGFPMFILPCTNDESISTENRPLVEALSALPKPTGVLLPQDAVGPPFIRLCTELGLRVPDDIAVLGVNNLIEVCHASTPALSSIDIAIEQIGRIAARTVVAMIEGETVAPITTIPPADLVPRESTNVRKYVDDNVQIVLDYMQQNLNRKIEKEDLVEKQTFGRRALEKHFKAAFGEAPMQYLRTLRLQKARHLLETTSLTVVDISRECGIYDANYLCRLFRARFNKSPLQHRKQFATT